MGGLNMSGNPYKIWDKVSGDVVIERCEARIEDTDKNSLVDKLKWQMIDEEHGYEVLELCEIYEQVKQMQPVRYRNEIPFIRVYVETGLWGVIYEVGNYEENGSQWIVHGVTKGYA